MATNQLCTQSSEMQDYLLDDSIHYIIRNIRKKNLAEVFMFMPDKIVHQSPHLDKIYSIKEISLRNMMTIIDDTKLQLQEDATNIG
jgi:hypothetical protein